MFHHHINATFAYQRMYEQNKTGASMAAVYNEYTRIFHRHANQVGGCEHKFSFVVPITENSAGLDVTLQSIGAQTLPDYEVVLVDYGNNPKFFRGFRKEVTEFCCRFPITLRFIKSDGNTHASALSTALSTPPRRWWCSRLRERPSRKKLLPGCDPQLSDNAVASLDTLRQQPGLLKCLTRELNGQRI